MKTYKYTDATNTVVHVIDEDGISRMSMMASALPEGTVVEPADPPPVPVITSVTMRQARLALLRAGLLDDVDAAIAAIPDPVQRKAAEIEWEYAQTVDRNSPFTQQMAAGLTLTAEQLDALFTQAAGL